MSSLAVLAQGKTKIIYPVEGRHDHVRVLSKDDITGGDGAKHDIIPGKGVLANTTTCNVFEILSEKAHTPMAFVRRDGPDTFIARNCKMLPYEVVVRREACSSSYIKRTGLKKGEKLDKPQTEFFLKTNERRWCEHSLPCDDPLMLYQPSSSTIELYLPGKPMSNGPFLVLGQEEVFTTEGEANLFEAMSRFAVRCFLVLENEWYQQGGRLLDFKVEYGLDSSGNLLLADVIDNDSWRVIRDGVHIDKQAYRDGEPLDIVEEKYRLVAELTSKFR